MPSISEGVYGILLQSIFQNTGSEVTKGKDGKTNILGTPTETAILEFGLLMGGDFKTHHIESEIVKVEPFNSEKKKMSVLVSLPDSSRVRAFCKGASEIVLKMCDNILTSDGKAVPLSENQRQKITDVINGFACEALRTLCLAFKDIEKTSDADSIPDSNYTLIAVVGIKDPVRPGVKEAVRTCLAAGITVRMVTGDNINTAKAIAKECGILTDTGLAIEGPDFRNKSSQELEEIIPRLQVMARSSPLDKHKLVTQLRNVFKEVVAVTGDGTNDAPALSEADIGLAMGIAGTEVFNEINSRDMEKINVFKGIFSSWIFLAVMISTVVFQIVIVEFLGTFANTVPLSWELWLASVLIGAASLVIAVILKCIPVETKKDGNTAKHHDGYEPLPSGPDLAVIGLSAEFLGDTARNSVQLDGLTMELIHRDSPQSPVHPGNLPLAERIPKPSACPFCRSAPPDQHDLSQ
ncbi:CATION TRANSPORTING ATPASE [Salix purpurea]|uniref:P-type Cu(+) transporter n=1 Tax=Salix purpurea TaxID=77065 RepID=A0A9Q0TKF2_SALPP|nr:CATION TRANSPORTING ATPASE [Salix purpurea]